jgi:hypothetical protein
MKWLIVKKKLIKKKKIVEKFSAFNNLVSAPGRI